jgi:hypothetical protein
MGSAFAKPSARQALWDLWVPCPERQTVNLSCGPEIFSLHWQPTMHQELC